MEMEIFLAAPPGLEALLAAEAGEKGFARPVAVPGGVTVQGGWPEVWRTNRELRGAGRVLARIGGFRAFHLAQLDKRARKFAWGDVLRPDVPVRVEASCRGSRIYHAGAAAQRIERAIAEELGAPVAAEAALRVLARIDDNLVTLSVDTSGDLLHRRGHKSFVGKAPMRETLAALFLRACGYDGTEPVLDPMCGSGTFVLEAAEIAATGLAPGRSRHFAYESLASFDATALPALGGGMAPEHLCFGHDRDSGAIAGATANAARAGVGEFTRFTQGAISDLPRPEGPPGLVIVNPPYGTRIGQKKLLYGLYGALGEVLRSRFSGWRVGIVTTEGGLAKATGLSFSDIGPPVPHGSLKIRLYRTEALS
ncbi:THUMP domain-containing class I SAM-dependent RNA methyltransferase [Roseisalinus antarcticus]|uniref:Ribosomal RNA large subunit methyltransferase L n=1 Tax=Roseisalinus antarcticus TaxID=254357 RepID=A0A1Y5SW94_9RHOB|nr:RNA methyltransferase [Roseisalinus antarcticus]SLN47998.1 Ribosomal RNA large subunit methyltransferase L [Roseisalinus antarcticus]